MKSCGRDPNEVEALLRERDFGEKVCPDDGLRPGEHGWSSGDLLLDALEQIALRPVASPFGVRLEAVDARRIARRALQKHKALSPPDGDAIDHVRAERDRLREALTEARRHILAGQHKDALIVLTRSSR